MNRHMNRHLHNFLNLDDFLHIHWLLNIDNLRLVVVVLLAVKWQGVGFRHVYGKLVLFEGWWGQGQRGELLVMWEALQLPTHDSICSKMAAHGVGDVRQLAEVASQVAGLAN
jgi:hypothetical protein